MIKVTTQPSQRNLLMISIPQNLRYLAQTLNTRYYMAKTYRNGASVAFICRRYEFSKASLMR